VFVKTIWVRITLLDCLEFYRVTPNAFDKSLNISDFNQASLRSR